MGTFKENLYDICKDVVSEFPDWSFTGGQFKNKSMKHTELLVDLGFAFQNGRTPFGGAVFVNNKKTVKLYKNLLSWSRPTSILVFQSLANELIHTPEKFRFLAWIEQDKEAYLAILKNIGKGGHNNDRIIDLKDVKPVLQAVLRDGIALIERHYDLSSEENLLQALPPKYTPRALFDGAYDEFEGQKGLMMCVVRMALGDFEFVERYRSDEYQTFLPKRTVELDKIVAALPERKKRYAETGSVI